MISSECEPTVSVIIPVYNGGQHFRSCLQSFADSDPIYKEIIVIADENTDDACRLAKEFDLNITVLQRTTTEGPAKARNIGACMAEGAILFFVDSDVTVRHDTVSKIVAAFQNNPDLDGLFGSYDDTPSESNFLSQYKNLFHHYVHQTSHEESFSFWSGCGAIRRSIFMEIGGFNEQYSRPSCEDIELGYRLKIAGYKIRLMKNLQVKHLKHWDFLTLLKTDFFYRALPWTDLIITSGRFINDLNLKISDRISVVFIYLLILVILGALFLPWLLLAAVVCLCVLLAFNWNLYYFFMKKRGTLFAIKAIPCHWFYLFYCGIAFFFGIANHYIRKLMSRVMLKT